MKYTFYLKAAKNGGVIVVVRGNSAPINPLVEAAEAMANKMNKDPMLLAAEAMANENNQLQEAYEKADLTGDYYFNWYTPDGIKKNPTDQAFEFIRYLIEEFGLGCEYGYVQLPIGNGFDGEAFGFTKPKDASRLCWIYQITSRQLA